MTPKPTTYRFDERRIANWTMTQEKTISTEYPFHSQSEEFAAHTYLQFLWLPESLMPLHLFIPSLQRVNVPSTSTCDASSHPILALLEPLLLTTRSVMKKYHVELPRILADGGGAGEMEETMMWYALTNEKADESLVVTDGPWNDSKWREAYLQRMERREVLIQILLHFHKLTFPAPPPAPPPPPPKKRKFTGRPVEPVEPTLTTEDQLELFMDKVSMWQLTRELDRAEPKEKERDWVQVFAEDVIEKQFKSQLPELCSLLRSKVFPSSPFSDDETSNAPTSRNVSPEPVRRELSRAPSNSRLPSPALSTSSRTTTNGRALVRSRSRSLSVSLAQEQQERERAINAPSKKRVLNREVSMSRVFKPKPKPDVRVAIKKEAPAPAKPKSKDLGITLVEDTPVKPRVASVASLSFGRQSSLTDMLKGGGPKASAKPVARAQLLPLDEDDGGDEWVMDSSPDIVLLNPTRGSSASSGLTEMDSDDEEYAEPPTPSKPSRARRR